MPQRRFLGPRLRVHPAGSAAAMMVMLAVALGACSTSSIASPTAVGSPGRSAVASPTNTSAIASPRAVGSLEQFSLTTCTATCPLGPGMYQAQFHDPFAIAIEDSGWQQEPGHGADVVVLSRTDDPQQRLTFYPAQTIALADAADLASRIKSPALPLGDVRTTSIGGAPAVQVDVTPTAVAKVAVMGGPALQLQPGLSDRITVAQEPMSEEGALHVIVAEAPIDRAEFLALADRILQTLTFSR